MSITVLAKALKKVQSPKHVLLLLQLISFREQCEQKDFASTRHNLQAKKLPCSLYNVIFTPTAHGLVWLKWD